MRLLIFTLLLSMLSLSSLFADVREWNISNDEFNALGEISATTTVNGLTIYATADKTVVVEPNGKTLDGMEFTTRMKLGGAGSLEAGAEYRAVSIDVTGNTTISVAAISSSSSADREFLFINAAGDTLHTAPVYGANIDWAVFDYVGEATTIYMASKSSGINIYYIKAEGEGGGGEEPPVVSDPLAIFDPATVDPADLKPGMEIVEIGGKKYLQVVVDAWNSILDVPAFKFEPGMTAFTEFKYVVTQTEYTAAQINATVQLIDTVNLMKPSWSNDSVSTTTGLVQSNPDGTFKKVSAGAAATSKVVHQVQFFGQQNVSWGAVVGDTLWVGKVRAYVKDDASTIANPETYDPSNLPANWEIVDVEGAKYFKVHLEGWNNVLPVTEFSIPAGATDYSAMIKFEKGTSTYEMSQVNTFFKIANVVGETWTELGAGGAASSATFKKYSFAIKDATKTVSVVQVAGQETSGWGAITGDYLYIGKVTANVTIPPDPDAILDPATFDAANLKAGWEIVTIGDKKYFKVPLDGWSTWMNVPEYKFPAGRNAFRAEVKYEAGTSGAALDGLGAFLKFSTSGWAEIGAGRTAVGTEFAEQVVTMAANEGNVAGVFQIAVQDANNGYSALVGDFLYIGKISACTTAPVTFTIDDTKFKAYDGFVIRGSWLTKSGIFDSAWNGGVDHAEFTDSVLVDAENEVWEVDNIWEYTVNLVADGGTNTWKWGFLDLNGNWKVTGADPTFQVSDWTPQTITYTIGGTSVEDLSSKLKIYPNPVVNILNVTGMDIESVSIYNLTGAKVHTGTSNSIDVSNLSKGTYVVKAIDQNGEVAISKFSKN